ncbi:MAG TPA: hypothetical protein VK338_06125, partial [Candidatus Nitrosocosmicus sp.]|nr:hypothetical protein [Candidatus Nitrosocosmicus sp.]
EGALGRALNLMHKSIASDNPEFASTAILAVIHPGKDSDYLTYASIGDSHLYVFSDDNLQQLNSDDVDYSKKGEPLTRYLGGDKIGAQVDENNVNSIAIPEKARCIMLASDGVYKYIHPDTLTDLMPLALKSDNPAKFILDKIKQIRGEELGEPDNRIYPDDASIVILKLDTHDNSALSYALRDVINESEGNRHGVLESIAIPSRDAEEKQRLIKEQITQINNLTDDMVYHTLQQRDFQGMLMEPGQYEGGAIQPEQVVGTALLEATKRIRFMELPEEGMSVDQALRFSLVGYLTKMADRSVHTKPLEEAIQNFTREKSEYEERMKASQSLIDQRHIERLIRDTATDIELVREQIERVRTNPRLESNTLQEKLYRYIHQTIQTTVGDTLALRTLPFEQAQLYLHLAAMLKIPLDKNVINTLPFESPNLDTINVFSYADSKQEWEKLQG